MTKRHTFRKTKPGKPIPVTARQLESLMLEHNGRFKSRDYDKFERMEPMESLVHDAIHELKTYSLETLTQRFDVRLFGRGKHVFARLDAEDNNWYYFSLAYIPRASNNRDINDAMIQMVRGDQKYLFGFMRLWTGASTTPNTLRRSRLHLKKIIRC